MEPTTVIWTFTRTLRGYTLIVAMCPSSSILIPLAYSTALYIQESILSSTSPLSRKKKTRKGPSAGKNQKPLPKQEKKIESGSVGGSRTPDYLTDLRDHSKRYLDKDYCITYLALSKHSYGPFTKYTHAFDLLVEMFGSEEEVPEEIEIDVVEPRLRKKLLEPESFELDLKKMWGVFDL